MDSRERCSGNQATEALTDCRQKEGGEDNESMDDGEEVGGENVVMDDAASSGGPVQEFSEDDTSVNLAFSRIKWRKESESDKENLGVELGTMWNAVMSAGIQKTKRDRGNYQCAFNEMFSGWIPDDGAGVGLDHLFGLFGNPSQTTPKSTPVTSKSSPRVELSVLTQRGKNLAEEIHAEVASNASRLLDLEEGCPEWRENVAYAMQQTDAGDLRDALSNVKQSRAKLEMMKNCFMKAWHQQQRVLNLYELSLSKSLGRLGAALSPNSRSGVHYPFPVESRSLPPLLQANGLAQLSDTTISGADEE